MKAQERHKLKTNELAQTLSHLPEYLKKYGNHLLIGLAVLVVLIVAGFWWHNARLDAQRQRVILLGDLLARRNVEQNNAAYQAQLGQAGQQPDLANIQPYDGQALADSFAQLAAQAPNTGFATTALLAQAESLRSQLYFPASDLDSQQLADIRDRAQTLYQQIISLYPQDYRAVGQAQLGLGLLAEGQADWEKARQIYDAIIADADGKLAGTPYPMATRQRLSKFKELQRTVLFAEAIPQPALQPLPAEQPAPATP